MRITPDSTITLYQNVDIDNGEQLVFSSRANQTAYFQSKIHPNGAYTPCTVVRKTGTIRVEKPGSVVAACNYLSFVNPTFDNKTIYARIIDYEYVNNECVEISYLIDYWQTWMFDVTFQDSYIEREHLSQEDFTKAETNPYDPTILEFKTSEALPIGKDIEKPYYEIGTGTQTEDGAFIGKRVETQYSLHQGVGTLIVFSNINLENLDSSSTGTTPPSEGFYKCLQDVAYTWVGPMGQGTATKKSDSLGCFQITGSTYGYLYRQWPGEIDQMIEQGTQYQSTGGSWGTAFPFQTNRIKSPVNYVYIDPNDTLLVDRFLSWFTDVDKLDSILGIYGVPTGLMLLSGTFGSSLPFIISMATASGQSVVNKKLDLYPYSYFRLMAPNGDVKELKIEDFKSAQDSNSDCTLAATLDVVEKPNFILGPIQYKCSGGISPYNSGVGMNGLEALMFGQFCCLPYEIDGFKSQMAAVSNSIIGNNTMDYKYEQEGSMSGWEALKGNIAARAVSGFEDLAKKLEGTPLDFLSSAALTASNVANDFFGQNAAYKASKYNRTLNTAEMSSDAYKALSGDEDNAVYDNFKYSKPAYAANIYHPINGDGVTNYNVNTFMDILVLRVSLHPEILAQYDNYFSQFGYTSGRCGIPRVVNYVHGSTTAADVPHWTTINSKQTTYIKTRNCMVIHSMLPVASFIKAMFDSGVRMIKGDLT